MATLLPSGKQAYSTALGLPLVGGKVYTYAAGTNTPKATWADAGQTAPNTNPVVLDARGEASIFWNGAYKIVLRDLTDAIIWTQDNCIAPDMASYATLAQLAAPTGVNLVGGALKQDMSNSTYVNSQFQGESLFAPIGNPSGTYGWFNAKMDDKHDDQREFMFCLGSDFRHGGGGNSVYQWDKVVQYNGCTVGGAVKNAWIRNDLMRILPGATPNYLNGYELDMDPQAGSYGTADGAAGFVGTNVHAMTLNGYSGDGYTITSAIALISSSPLSKPLYERGFMVGPTAVRQAAFDDYSAAVYSHRDAGSHVVGLEMAGVYSTAAMRIPNGVSISSRNSGGSTARMLNMDSLNNVRVGDPVFAANIFAERSILPSGDNLYQLGSSSQRWASVWAVNGTIQTSDASLKDDIAPIDPVKASLFIDALVPKSWRWKVGGAQPIYATEQQEVLVGTEKRTIKVMKSTGEYEDAQERGRKVKAPVRREAEVEIDVPITEVRDVEIVTGYEPVAGKRTHFGSLACDVKAAAAAAGFGDFGGYVVGEDGTEALRPDQILAIALVEIRSLRARLAKLEKVRG